MMSQPGDETLGGTIRMNNYSSVLRPQTNGKNYLKIALPIGKGRTVNCRTPEKVEAVAANTG